MCIRDRAKTLVELVEMSRFLYEPLESYEPKAAKKHLRVVILPALESVTKSFEALSDWNKELIVTELENIMRRYELKFPKLAMPIRVAVTGSSFSPSIDDILLLLGRDRSTKRLKQAIRFIQARAKENA